jgi:hypothetical protein
VVCVCAEKEREREIPETMLNFMAHDRLLKKK